MRRAAAKTEQILLPLAVEEVHLGLVHLFTLLRLHHPSRLITIHFLNKVFRVLHHD